MFALDEDRQAIREMASQFAAERIAPFALEWDAEKHFPVDVFREAGALGMGGIYVREDVGGSGLGRLDAALIFEALASGCPSTASFISTMAASVSVLNMALRMIDAVTSVISSDISIVCPPRARSAQRSSNRTPSRSMISAYA